MNEMAKLSLLWVEFEALERLIDRLAKRMKHEI